MSNFKVSSEWIQDYDFPEGYKKEKFKRMDSEILQHLGTLILKNFPNAITQSSNFRPLSTIENEGFYIPSEEITVRTLELFVFSKAEILEFERFLRETFYTPDPYSSLMIEKIMGELKSMGHQSK